MLFMHFYASLDAIQVHWSHAIIERTRSVFVVLNLSRFLHKIFNIRQVSVLNSHCHCPNRSDTKSV